MVDGRARIRWPRPRLGVVLAQYERPRHRDPLPALLGALSRLDAESTVVVVDNRRPGEWTHTLSRHLHHIGGDNRAWEFSAFDRGIDWLLEEGREADLVVLATDALLAYGGDFLELIDDRVIASAVGAGVGVGWIDSFTEPCELLGFSYEAWLRTSLVLLPTETLARLRPLTQPLDEGAIFGPSPHQPFRSDAPLSTNLRRLLLSWLTTNGEASALGSSWHSRFELEADSFAYFKAKVSSILREHLLSARLAALGVGAYDLRALRHATSTESLEAALEGPQASSWQWLGWRRRIFGSSSHDAACNGSQTAGPSPIPGPVFIVAPTGLPAAARYIERRVLPLVRQRHVAARLIAPPAPPAGAPCGAVAMILAPGERLDERSLGLARTARLPVVGAVATANAPPIDGHDVLGAETPWELAAACCRLIEQPYLRQRLAQAVAAGSDAETNAWNADNLSRSDNDAE